MKKRQKAFTLVELAIVITIIGLLIGGVLKGQELLENARMTSTATQLKSLSSAVVTFKDIYKALPGDMLNPSNFIQNCTAAPCNVSGDGNGVVGTLGTWGSDETNNFWVHLAKSNLISGVDPNVTWTSTTYYAPPPTLPMGAKPAILFYNLAPQVAYTEGVTGPVWNIFSNTGNPAIRNDAIAKYDLKTDDGRPTTGDVLLHSLCTPTGTNPPYNPNDKTLCVMFVKAEFR